MSFWITLLFIGNIFCLKASPSIDLESTNVLDQQIDTIPPISFLEFEEYHLEEEEEATSAVARAYEDSIRVRWYPPDFYSWYSSIAQGYLVKKYEVTSGALIAEFRTKIWDQEQFIQYVASTGDSTVLVAAALIYEEYDDEDIEEIIQTRKSDVYGYSIVKGFENPTIMESIGLQFTDREVTPGSTYKYEITRIEQDDTGIPVQSEVTVTNEFIPLSSLENISIDSSHLSVDVSIDLVANQENYVMYRISQSASLADPYVSVTKDPIFFSDDSIKQTIGLFKVPVTENYVDNYFRIEGMNIFGEYGPPELLAGYGVDTIPPPAPFMQYPEVIDSHIIVLWEPIVEVPDDFAGYRVQMGSTPFGEDYENISDLIPLGTDIYRFPVPDNTDEFVYLRVASYDIHNNYDYSYSSNVIFRDTIPPDPPNNFVGEVTDEGIVTLSWDSIDERLRGYRVFFANDTTYEFSQVSQNMVLDTMFMDTLALNMLSDEVYYMVEAEDWSYNRSAFSKILIVQRPDTLAPVAPVMLPTESNGDGIIVNWRASTSFDVVMHYLYRKESSQSIDDWVLLDSIPYYGERYVDNNTEMEVVYDYKILAMDDVSLLSDYTLAVSGRRYFDEDINVISDLKVDFRSDPVSTVVSWSPKEDSSNFLASQDYRYVIYRGNSIDDLARLVQLIDKTPQYVDNDIELGYEYIYAVQLLYADGKKSKISDPVLITLK